MNYLRKDSELLRRMALQIASLNSGSNGNCYYIGNENEAVFVDAGLSCRETERRMKSLGLDMGRVKAVFISHEHTDHVCGLPSLLKKWMIPMYITGATRGRCASLRMPPHQALPFTAGEPVSIGDLQIMPFRKSHDACDPHSFVVSGNGVHIAVITDIGRVCDEVIRYFRQCHAAFLEANYDEVMLEQGRYPWYLKNRIRGGKGHISNRQALELFRNHRHKGLTHLLLSHLSKENNHPELVLGQFQPYAGDTCVAIASRHRESEVYTITASEQTVVKNPAPGYSYSQPQLSLF